MEYKNWHTVTSIVDQVLDLPEKERKDFINTVCGDDNKTRQEVEKFLDSIKNSEGLWSDLLQSNRVLVNDFTSSMSVSEPLHKLPGQIDRYKIVKRIASGGMGHVYLAERNDGQFLRKVAIKVLRNELHSDTNINRFYKERSILSSLEHPNIARLYDGGMTDDGRPFLVMEYVDGVPIHRYVQENKLKLRDILDLFEQVCDAVRYAHNHFVIHRDLKPDNIFVTSSGTVKVLDFGVAKIVDPANTESSVTQDEKSELILSLLYAAPEQVQRGKITAATDVYMLGVILYELLTGIQPFLKSKTLSFSEASKVIAEYIPPLPSESDQKDQKRSLKGDLDAVIGKAMHKDPDERYQSAGSLISDLHNYRANQPVSARTPTIPYRTGKYLRRNRQIVGTTSFFLILAAFFLTYHISLLTEERNIALLESEKSRMVTSFMTDIFSSADPAQNFEDTLTVYQLLDRGRDRILQLSGQPELQADLLLAMGQSYANLGSYEQSKTLLHRADSVAQATYPEDAIRQVTIANEMGNLYEAARDFEYARSLFERSYSLSDRLPDSEWWLKRNTYHGMGKALTGGGDAAQGEQWLRDAIQIHQNNGGNDLGIRSVNVSLAMNLRVQNRYEESETLYSDILAGLDEQNPDDYSLFLSTLNNLGYLNRVLERYEDAEIYYRRALSIGLGFYGNEHPRIFTLMNNLSSVLSFQGKYEESLQILEEKAFLARERYGNNWQTGRAIGVVGRFLFQWKEFDKAAEKFLESENIYLEVLGKDHFWTGYENLFRHISLKNADRFNESLTTLPTFEAMVKNRDTFTTQDSASLSYLIEQIEEYSVADMDQDLQELRALLNR